MRILSIKIFRVSYNDFEQVRKMNIKPIEESVADQNTRRIYKEIRESFDSASVPIVFRYMANFPDFLEFAWEKLNPIINSVSFEANANNVAKLSDEAIKIIFYPDDKLKTYIDSLNPSQKTEIQDTVNELKILNSKLLLIMIAIRESLKGISVPDQKFIAGNSYARNSYIQITHDASSDFLITDFKVKYDDFYTLINKNIEELVKTEKYLKSRVELEKFSQHVIESFENPIVFPFSETVILLRKYPYSSELLFLLNSTFPSNYPNLLFTSSVIDISLNSKGEISI